jgi:fimbrial chaperone protein
MGSLVAVFGFLGLGSTSFAASLNISPILLEAPAPQQTLTLTLRNTGDRPMTGQVRVYAWSQPNGEDDLQETEAVEASPPLVDVRPGADYAIRVVRAAGGPVSGEEAYRLVVEEVPEAAARRGGVVQVVMRYVIPVFFFDPSAGQARLSWSVVHKGGAAFLAAQNDGDRAVKLLDIRLGGKPAGKENAGWVLGHSQRLFPLGKTAAGNLRVTAIAGKKPIDATAEAK